MNRHRYTGHFKAVLGNDFCSIISNINTGDTLIYRPKLLSHYDTNPPIKKIKLHTSSSRLNVFYSLISDALRLNPLSNKSNHQTRPVHTKPFFAL